MNTAETKEDVPTRSPAGRRWLKRLLILWLVLSVLLFLLNQSFVLLEPPVRLALGWVLYLRGVIPRVHMNAELLLCSLGALVLGMLGMQGLMRRLVTQWQWAWRHTFVWCAVLIVMFCTSIAAVGIVHQIGWLFRLPNLGVEDDMSSLVVAERYAMQVVSLAKWYAHDHGGRFPDTFAEFAADPEIFMVALDQDEPLEPLIYVGEGLRDTDSGYLPVVWSSRPNSEGLRVVGRLNGKTELIKEEKFQELLAEFRERQVLRKKSATGG